MTEHQKAFEAWRGAIMRRFDAGEMSPAERTAVIKTLQRGNMVPVVADATGDPERGAVKLKADPGKYAGATIFDTQADRDVEAFRKVERDKAIREAFAAARQKAVKSAVADAHLTKARQQPSAKSARTHKRIGEGFFASVWS